MNIKKDLIAVRTTLQTLTIVATRDNMNSLLGSIQVLDEIIRNLEEEDKNAKESTNG